MPPTGGARSRACRPAPRKIATSRRDGRRQCQPVAAVLNGWPVHEVGRNADLFDPDAAPLLKAGSVVVSDSVHLHSNGRDTRARLEIGFKFHPNGCKPKYRRALAFLGNGMDIDIKPMEANQQLHAYAVLQEHTQVVTFEPHLHAPGALCASKRSGHEHPDTQLLRLRSQRGARLRVRGRLRPAAAEGDDPAHLRLHG